MEDNIIINVQNVSMKFNLSSEKIDSFKEYIIKTFKRQVKYDEFWALRNITFSIKKGCSIGLVGLNGSGKSTMLKIIAGVMKPSLGTVQVKGSIAPLIELGAGFDNDLTARENVYLNGALLGYERKIMEGYYEDIVMFSELQNFMDVPVKNFSSGMVARLAFSIATVGKPEILIIDEVLSVGDYQFQKKCESRIFKMKNKGVTILFVSHSFAQVNRVCDSVIWLEKGLVKKMGKTEDIEVEFENYDS